MLEIGCDIEENKRFANKTLKNDKYFLEEIFTQNELKYCFKKSHPAKHLCARFCAKEAVVKALTSMRIYIANLKDIEVLNYKNGVPYIKIKNYDNIKVQVSLSHTKDYSVAFVIIN